MIFYFSGTGNSFHAAHFLARNESVVNVANAVQKNEYEYTLAPNEMLGFVFPVYFYGVAHTVAHFLARLKILTTSHPYTYLVFTCGTFTGNAVAIVQQNINDNSISIDAFFAVRGVDNYIPMFSVPSEKKQSQIFAASDVALASIRDHIDARSLGDFNSYKGPFARWITPFLYSLYRRINHTRKFTVNKHCIHCGRCVQYCPSKIIVMQNNTPSWTAPKCDFCMGCINRCSARAIEYGLMTRFHGRFTHPDFKD